MKNKKTRRILYPITSIWIFLLVIMLLAFSVLAEVKLSDAVGVSGLEIKSIGNTAWNSDASQKVSWSGTTTSSCQGMTTVYSPLAGELTLKNISGKAQMLSFDCSLTLNNGSCLINGSAAEARKYSIPMADGDTVTISVSSSANSTNTTTVTLTNIALSVPKVTVTFNPATSGGSYTVDNVSIASSVSYEKEATTTYALKATPAANQVFVGWYLNGNLYSTNAIEPAATFENGGTITASFKEDPLYAVITVSGDTTAKKDDLVEINSRYYHDGSTNRVTAQSAVDNLSYYSLAVTTGVEADWDMQRIPDLSWNVVGSTIKIDKTVTAGGEYVAGMGRSWTYASMVSDVIQIHAKQDCVISFKYSNTIHIPNPDMRAHKPYVWVYQSAKGDETYSTIYSSAKKTLAENLKDEPFSISVPAGEYLYIVTNLYEEKVDMKYTAGSTTQSHTMNATLSEVTVTPKETKYTQTIHFKDNLGNPLMGGTIQINTPEYTYSADENGSVSGLQYLENAELTLSVPTVPKNYRLLGWRVNSAKELVCTPTYTYNLLQDTTIDAVFVPNYVTITKDGTYQYLNGQDETVNCNGEYIARNADATDFYTTLDSGFANTDIVVLLGNMTTYNDIKIPTGKTLVVPNAMNGISATMDNQTGHFIPETTKLGSSQYACLTVNGKLTVSGNLLVAGFQSEFGGASGGSYSLMQVVGTVAVKPNASLYGYGLVTGSGTINAEPQAHIHELCEVKDMPHPAKMNALISDSEGKRIIAFNIIFINSIEAKTVYQTGATLDGHFSVKYEECTQTAIRFIDTSTSLFAMTRGTLTKYFSTEDKQIVFQIDENAEVGTGAFEVHMKVKFGVYYPVDLVSSNYVMPLSSGWQIKVAGKFNVNHDVKLLPGAKLDVVRGGVLTIANNASLVFYRLNDYDYRLNPADATTPLGFCHAGYPVNMSRHADFTLDNVGSAKLNVDGTIIANGGLYVTTKPVEGLTPYGNGYNNLTGYGSIIMGTRETPLNQIYENQRYDQLTQTIHPCAVPVAPMKGLNPDADADTEANYQELSGTVYGYTNESGINVWGTDPCVAGHHTDTQTSSAEEGFLECDGCGIPLARLVAIEASADAATELSLKFLIHSELDVTPKVSFRMVNLKEGDGYTVTNDEKDRYILTIPVASGEMTDQMTVSFTTGAGDAVKPVTIIEADGTSATQVSRSVLDYASLVLERGSDAQKALIRALVTYGGYAQTYFADQGKNVTTNPLAYSVLGTDAPTLTANWSAKHKVAGFGDVQFVSWDAVLDSAIYLRLRMSSTATDKSLDGYTFTLKYPYKNGNTVTLLEKELEVYSHDTVEGDYYLDIAYIPAAFFDYPYVITVSDGKNAQQVVVRITDYLAGYLDNGNSGTKLAQAMYEYGKAAEKFFFPNGMTQPDIAE